jgi:hypothetical protein
MSADLNCPAKISKIFPRYTDQYGERLGPHNRHRADKTVQLVLAEEEQNKLYNERMRSVEEGEYDEHRVSAENQHAGSTVPPQ